MRYFDTFSGIGGFPLGIELAYETLGIGGNTKKRSEDVRQKPSPHRSDGQGWGSCPPTCIGYSEIDKYATQIYERHYPEHKNYGDITQINAEELPDFDCLVGGVPCQSWSIAGKRGGFEDERGNMWFQYARILRAKQPKYFIAENVKGLLSHDGGKSMERICEELCDCGYAIDFEVLNSKNHGVPQNRQRVFIIGVRLDLLDQSQIF
jgi:DNA (cytosine-5)-methyltransferase 1